MWHASGPAAGGCLIYERNVDESGSDTWDNGGSFVGLIDSKLAGWGTNSVNQAVRGKNVAIFVAVLKQTVW